MTWKMTVACVAAVAVLIGACGGQNGRNNDQPRDDQPRNGAELEDSVAAAVRQAQRELDSLAQRANEQIRELGEDIEEEEVVQTVEESVNEAVQAAKARVDSLARQMQEDETVDQVGESIDNAVQDFQTQVNDLLQRLGEDESQD
ncbi:MAG: hypothetical protein GF331_27390 [Chitinivibrionales bacterium]|nr:hypothetical protein [Chitinivibrionales bacterium]